MNETIGDYAILGRLAVGGMAEILLAKRVGPMGFSKPVVVKRLLPQLASDTMFTTMFLNEAKLAARLTHPNIVQINDLGQAGASFYIAMEYLPGEDLATVVRVLGARKATVPVPLAVRIVADAAAALHYAHSMTGDDGQALGIVHRDVSPQNIVLTTAGVVKLVDFGIAKAEDRDVKTQTGVVKGKVEYMPPEQLAGKRVDHRADIFSLGVVLYEALCGKRPVDLGVSVGDRLAGAATVVPLPERMPEVHPELARIVAKAMAPEPKNRHQSADELRIELEAFLEAFGSGVGLAELSGLLVKTFGARHVAALDRRLHSFQSTPPAAAPGIMPGGAPVRDGGTKVRPQPPAESAPPPEASIALDIRDVRAEPRSTVKRPPEWQQRFGKLAAAAVMIITILAGAAVFATRRDDRVSLHVTSNPAGARVMVDEVQVGVTPTDVLNLTVDRAVEIRIAADDYRDYREVVTPQPGVVARALHATLVSTNPAVPAKALREEPTLVAQREPELAVAPRGAEAVVAQRGSEVLVAKGGAEAPAAQSGAEAPAAKGDAEAPAAQGGAVAPAAQGEPEILAARGADAGKAEAGAVPAIAAAAPTPAAAAPARERATEPGAAKLAAALRRIGASKPAPHEVAVPIAQSPAPMLAPVSTSGFLTVTSGVPMRVFANGVDLGMTPMSRAKVAAGRVALKLVGGSEGMTRTTWVDVAPDATVVHRVSLERGSISIDGAPGSRVFVGSRELGVTPLAGIPLLAGDYVVTVEHVGTGVRVRHPVTVTAHTSSRIRAD